MFRLVVVLGRNSRSRRCKEIKRADAEVAVTFGAAAAATSGMATDAAVSTKTNVPVLERLFRRLGESGTTETTQGEVDVGNKPNS